VTAEGWVKGISRLRWISRTSGRSFGRFPGAGGVRDKELAFWRNLARGRVERSDSSTSISLEDNEELDPAEDLRRLFVSLEDGRAHSGTGFRSSNCLRNRFVYSVPLTTSSAALILSFRSREFPASETANRSSSLSSHAGAFSFSPSSCSRC
jgi:hypothetical protein